MFLGLHFATWIASLDYTSVASSVVLVSLGPVFVGIGSWLLLGERPGMGMIVGLGLATTGSIVIGWGDLGGGANRLLGDVLALAGAVFVAGYLMIGRRARGHLSLTAYIAVVYGVAMVTLLVMVWVSGQADAGFHAGRLWVGCSPGPGAAAHGPLDPELGLEVSLRHDGGHRHPGRAHRIEPAGLRPPARVDHTRHGPGRDRGPDGHRPGLTVGQSDSQTVRRC